MRYIIGTVLLAYVEGLGNKVDALKDNFDVGWTTKVKLVSAGPSSDAIGWQGTAKDIMTDPKYCITPAPFGQQCTAFKKDAIYACLSIPKCTALTCPDDPTYVKNPKFGAGLCQPRISQKPNEIRLRTYDTRV